MPFDNRGPNGMPSLSPTTNKSVMPFNNVPTIQDILDGKVKIEDIYPHARGNWAPGKDVSKSYKDTGDDYKRKERDLDILNNMLGSVPPPPQKWKVKVPGGSVSFISLDLAQKYLRRNKLSLKYLSRVAQNHDNSMSRLEIIADSLSKCFLVESLSPSDDIKEVGSAFCIEKNHFITCAHVIKKYNKNNDIFIEDFGSDVIINLFQHGKWHQAELVGVDLAMDIALIKADINVDPFKLSQQYSIGEDVIAIGSPHGYENNVSMGIISSVNRKPMVYENAPDYMFVDLSVFPGSSGGPIVKELTGEVVGMVTLIITDNETEYGLNAGLPVEYIEQFYKSAVK